MTPMRELYFGDNLAVLREHGRDESVDLIYLDPPFNSNASYNVLFKSPKGHESHAQIEAFDDTWHWGEPAEAEFHALLHQPNTPVAEMIQALRRFLGENDLMAYLVMMTSRLLELHRVLKPTGSLYLHCDPTASHYLKLVLDGVFGKEQFRNEIVWLRTNAHNMHTRGYARSNDTIFFYTKTKDFIWNQLYTAYSSAQLSRYKQDEDGRFFTGQDLTISGNRNRHFTWRGTTPSKNRGWAVSIEQLEQWWHEGKILTKQDGTPRLDGLKVFLDEKPGKVIGTNWIDIERIGNTSAERLGYPTQKPVALLERIIQASSNPGDVVLDPFCGCGTAIHAAEKLGRGWIGIDITHLSIALIEKRLRDAFPGLAFAVHGTPKDGEGARALAQRDKYQFQWWACSLVNAQPYQNRKKGADGGIDGLIYFQDGPGAAKKIVVSVKGGESVSVAMLRDLGHVVTRERAALGLFVTLAEPTPPMRTEAAKAGFYESPAFPGQTFPRLQLLTVAGLLAGTERPRFPDLAQGGLTFKTAPQETRDDGQMELF